MTTDRVVVIGAGIGGLSAALDLATRGLDVTVLESQAAPGGKMREVAVAGRRLDAGPTVLTLRAVFDGLFADAGSRLDDHVGLEPADILARHAWSADERLDLYADRDRSVDAIGAFAGAAAARGYASFCARARRVFETLDDSFMRAPRPSVAGLVARVGWQGLGGLWQGAPFSTLWRALGRHFPDPRLRQLFGRYATYCGSSPFAAPAVLMLVAHVEQDGVWLVRGGMHRLAAALAGLLAARGGRIRYAAPVAEILVAQGRAAGVRLASGERLPADAVVATVDAAALGAGLLGAAATGATPPMARRQRSLSAVTWSLVAATAGFPLTRHTVFFGRDYRAEFDDIFGRGRLPRDPTVYVCAQDRGAPGQSVGMGAPERLLCLVNAPADGDIGPASREEMEQCETRTFQTLERCGLVVTRESSASLVTTPHDFARLFPATGGALYGRSSHGWTASFRRPGARSRLPGLYLAGGSVHPGPGVPMAALSGRLAAASLIADRASTGSSRTVAMPGGMSTRSATTAATASR